MALVISTDDLPELENWMEGRMYKANLMLRQVSPTEDGEARFEVVQARGRPAKKKEARDARNPTFQQAADGAREEVSQEVESPGYRGHG